MRRRVKPVAANQTTEPTRTGTAAQGFGHRPFGDRSGRHRSRCLKTRQVSRSGWRTGGGQQQGYGLEYSVFAPQQRSNLAQPSVGGPLDGERPRMSNQERQAHQQHEPEVIGGGNDRRLVWANRVIDAIQTNPNCGEYPADMFRGLYGLLY